jgi:hypothetical protein
MNLKNVSRFSFKSEATWILIFQVGLPILFVLLVTVLFLLDRADLLQR